MTVMVVRAIEDTSDPNAEAIGILCALIEEVSKLPVKPESLMGLVRAEVAVSGLKASARSRQFLGTLTGRALADRLNNCIINKAQACVEAVGAGT